MAKGNILRIINISLEEKKFPDRYENVRFQTSFFPEQYNYCALDGVEIIKNIQLTSLTEYIKTTMYLCLR